MSWIKLANRHKKCIKPALWIASPGDVWLCNAKLGDAMGLRCNKQWRVERGSDNAKIWVEEVPEEGKLPTVNEFVAGYHATPVPREEALYWLTDSLPPILVPEGCEASAGYSAPVVLDALLEHFDVVRRP